VLRTEVEEQAQDNLKEVYAIQPQGPYYLAGHSIGGLVAYEMAQLLQNDGHEVAFLGLIDTGFPKKPKSLTSRFRQGLLDYWYTLCRLSPADRIRFIWQSIKATAQWRLKAMRCYYYHVVHKKLPADLLVFYIDEILFDREYLKARGRYQPRAYRGLIHIFKAEDSASDTEEWNAMTNRNLLVHEIAGSHLTIVEEPAVFELARCLKSCLEQTVTDPQRATHVPAYTSGTAQRVPALAFQRSTIRR
jgi:thioesterase domain-containing protein